MKHPYRHTILLLIITACSLTRLFSHKINVPHAIETIRRIADDNVQFAQFEFTDITGAPRTYTVTRDHAAKMLERGYVAFDGSSIPGFSDITQSDKLAVPDCSTYTLLPWFEGRQKTASIICDVHDETGAPYPAAPRTLLKAAVSKSLEQGVKLNVAPELEFFIYKLDDDDYFRVPEETDALGYCEAAERDPLHSMKLTMLNALQDLGLRPEKVHHEVAHSQHEITFHYDEALRMADNLTRAKNALVFIGRQYGYHVSFMPKPFLKKNGNGMHVHFSLWDRRTKKNIFYDSMTEHCISQTARHFIAGILKHINAAAAFTNPLITSYTRLGEGEAPRAICLGYENRTAAVRIPYFGAHESGAARAELRCPDPSANPYTLFAFMLEAGLEGIATHEQPVAETKDNVFTLSEEELAQRNIKLLPRSLGEALDAFEHSNFMKHTFGELFYDHYLKVKRVEINDFENAPTHKRSYDLDFNTNRVSAWEYEHYL